MSRIERYEAAEAAGKKKEKHKTSLPGSILSLIGTLIIVLTIILCLCLIVPRVAGMGAYVVVSGSMEPAIPVGSMVFSAETDPQALEPGDIIVFNNAGPGSVPVTHRVVENNAAAGEIVTKGDANEHEDIRPVPYVNVLGKVTLHIPYLGRAVSPLSTAMGKAGLIMVLIAGYMLSEAGARISRRE